MKLFPVAFARKREQPVAQGLQVLIRHFGHRAVVRGSPPMLGVVG
jgi:hypothetical protein